MIKIKFTLKPKKPIFRKKRIMYNISIFVSLFIILCLTFSILHSLSYNLEDNCCRHMSMKIEDKLESIGIDVKIMVGENRNSNESGHMWIKTGGIEFDSICLLPIRLDYINVKEFDDYSDYVEYKEEEVGYKIHDIADYDNGPLFTISEINFILLIVFISIISLFPYNFKYKNWRHN